MLNTFADIGVTALFVAQVCGVAGTTVCFFNGELYTILEALFILVNTFGFDLSALASYSKSASWTLTRFLFGE